MRRAVFLPVLLYTASGAVGLAWQVVWVRAFTPVFGAGIEAIAAVTACFLGGLGVGGALAGRLLKGRSGLRTYAGLELLVGVWGAALPWLLVALRDPLTQALASAGDAALLVRLSVALVLVAPPAIALGATFPAMAEAVESDGHPERVGLLYGMNALGAAVGALIAGMWLPWALGLKLGSAVLALGNVIVAVTAWCLDRGTVVEVGAQTPGSAPASLWLLVALTGFTGLSFEVTWSRLSSPLLAARFAGDAVAFAGVLAAVLVGIGLGGILARRAGGARSRALGMIQVLLAVCAFIILEPLRELVLGDRRFEAVEGVLPLVPALFVGATFPLLSNELMASGATVRGALGRLYAVNTGGAVLGSLLSGFVLIPTLGAQRYAVLLGGLAGLTGALALGRAGGRTAGALVGVATVAVTGFMLQVTPPVAGQRVLPPDEMVRAAFEGRETSTLVSERERGERALTSGGHRIDQAGGAINDHVMRAQGPAALHLAPKRVLAIGLGTGATARAFLDLEGLEYLKVIELDANQAELLHWFGTEDILDDPRLELVLGDGRHALRVDDSQWDVISVDAFGPRTASAAFYTADFYAEASKRLAPDGRLFVKFNPMSMPDEATLMSYVATMLDAFPAGALVYLDNGLFGLVGARTQITRGTVVAEAGSSQALFDSVPRVTDDHPVKVPNLVTPDLTLLSPIWDAAHPGETAPWMRRSQRRMPPGARPPQRR